MVGRTLLAVVAVVLLAVGHPPAVTLGSDGPGKDIPKKDEPKPKPDDKGRIPLPKGHELMRSKLKETQAILEGVALGDFDTIEKAANSILKITQAAAFLEASKSREYEVQMTLFRRSANAVKQKARDKNLEGVMLGYFDMQLSCMKCHEHTRDNKPDARLPELPHFAGK